MAPENYQRLVEPVRRILMEDWDPIGVAGIPQAADEYDGYIPGVLGLVLRRATPSAIADHLDHICSERMELKPDRRRSMTAAAKLLSLLATRRPC